MTFAPRRVDAFTALLAVAALAMSAVLPEAHVHLNVHADGLDPHVVHRHAQAHHDRDTPASHHAEIGRSDHGPDVVVWMGGDVATERVALPDVGPLLAILTTPLSLERYVVRDDWPAFDASAVHAPPRLASSSRAPPYLS